MLLTKKKETFKKNKKQLELDNNDYLAINLAVSLMNTNDINGARNAVVDGLKRNNTSFKLMQLAEQISATELYGSPFSFEMIDPFKLDKEEKEKEEKDEEKEIDVYNFSMNKLLLISFIIFIVIILFVRRTKHPMNAPKFFGAGLTRIVATVRKLSSARYKACQPKVLFKNRLTD